MTLDQLSIHQKAKIITIIGDKKLRRQVLEMGFVPEVIVYIENIAPWKGPFIVSIRGYLIMIRTQIAKMILVEVLS